MTAEEILKNSETSALNGNQFVSRVSGKSVVVSGGKKIKSFGAAGLITAMIIVFAVLFSSGNLIPSALSERLIEETDVQYADAVESKKLVFQQALYNGDLPENTIEILKQHNIEVKKTESGEQILVMSDKTVTADSFINEVNGDINLYNAFNDATYSRAAYYYDDTAKEVFKKIGTTRNNYNADSDFNEVMDSLLGKGSQIEIGNVVANQKNENGEQYTEYGLIDPVVRSDNGADAFIARVGAQNFANSTDEATLNSADSLKVADTISKEQRSKLFFLAFMENISKMKAGEGNDTKINEAMNYLNTSVENEIVNVETGEIIKVKGTALESPSLYSILSNNKVNLNDVNNYSSDRVLKTIENKINNKDASNSIAGTVSSAESNVKGSIGRFISSGNEGALVDILGIVNNTVNKSLINNSYETIQGVDAGEFLVEGAVNVGKDLAKASGATAGDGMAVSKYARLTNNVIAMDTAADRINRNPFDITSKNTFLGSIIYKLAISSNGASRSFLSSVKTFSNTVNTSVLSLISPTYAEDGDGYLTQFGDCETYGTIGVVGSPQCSEIATFDTSTLDNIFNNTEFIDFVNNNTILDESGTRKIRDDSVLADFILYNNERTTPLGVMDGGILESLDNNSSSIFFVSNISEMIQNFLGASEQNKKIASGAEYVNSSNNPNWSKYKYAQRYVSLARATESLRQYAGNSTSYNKIKFFEGSTNPVVSFINEYYALNN